MPDKTIIIIIWSLDRSVKQIAFGRFEQFVKIIAQVYGIGVFFDEFHLKIFIGLDQHGNIAVKGRRSHGITAIRGFDDFAPGFVNAIKSPGG